MMANRASTQLLQRIRGLADMPPAEMSDRELIERFATSRDEAAFAALVRRHGGMVLGVCRRILDHEQDAEDVFQAVFLVLSRKAGGLHRKDAVGPWLFGVAHRLALRARQAGRKRQAREPRAHEPILDDPTAELSVREAQALLDEELARLPERERGPVLLCYLQGLTRDEAAQRLGCPLGTLKSRLERARSTLQKRLMRRGLDLNAVVATLLVSDASAHALSTELVATTVRAALAYAAGSIAQGVAGVEACALANGLLRSMLLGKVKLAGVCLIVAACAGFALSPWLVTRNAAARQAPAAVAEEEEPAEQPTRAPLERASERKLEVDWPQWRGPKRDGVVRGLTVPEKWPKTLKETWTVPVGIGWSSPVVAGGRVFVFTRQKDHEVAQCFDLADGNEIWRSEPCPAPYKPGPGNPGDFNPRATPAVAGGHVYTHGITGIVSCLDAKTGKLIWRNDTGRYPTYGASASPLIDDGRCIVHVGGGWPNKGGLTSFDAATGDVKWTFEEWEGPGYASPILVDLAGERQIVTFRQASLVGVAAATGKLLWRVGLADFAQEKCITPVLYKDTIVFADKDEPLRAIRLEKEDKGLTVKEVWKGRGSPLHMSSPVLSGDWLLGFSGQKAGHFFCLDATTGATLWQSEGRMGPYASILNAGSVWLAQTVDGKLRVLRPSGTSYEVIAEYRVSDRQTWAHPVFLGDRILVKDDASLKLFRIE